MDKEEQLNEKKKKKNSNAERQMREGRLKRKR